MRATAAVWGRKLGRHRTGAAKSCWQRQQAALNYDCDRRAGQAARAISAGPQTVEGHEKIKTGGSPCLTKSDFANR